MKSNSPLALNEKPIGGKILALLDGFGDHFAEWFGRDLQIRLNIGGGVTTFLAWTSTEGQKGDLARHVDSCRIALELLQYHLVTPQLTYAQVVSAFQLPIRACIWTRITRVLGLCSTCSHLRSTVNKGSPGT